MQVKPGTLIQQICIAACFLIYANAIASSTEGTIDPDVDIDLMHFMEETNDQLSSDLTMKDKDKVLEGAQLLTELLQLVETHFTDWGQSDAALESARKSKALATDIIDAVQKNDFDKGTQLGIALSNQCESCHRLF